MIIENRAKEMVHNKLDNSNYYYGPEIYKLCIDSNIEGAYVQRDYDLDIFNKFLDIMHLENIKKDWNSFYVEQS